MPPKLDSVPPSNHRTIAWVFAAGGLGVATILFSFDPVQHAFYPQCLFHQWTGWNCPGCGGLRAGHQLLHGHLMVALRCNVLAVLGVPAGACWLWRELSPTGPRLGARWIWGIAGVILLFGIVRNLPGFGWLAP